MTTNWLDDTEFPNYGIIQHRIGHPKYVWMVLPHRHDAERVANSLNRNRHSGLGTVYYVEVTP